MKTEILIFLILLWIFIPWKLIKAKWDRWREKRNSPRELLKRTLIEKIQDSYWADNQVSWINELASRGYNKDKDVQRFLSKISKIEVNGRVRSAAMSALRGAVND